MRSMRLCTMYSTIACTHTNMLEVWVTCVQYSVRAVVGSLWLHNVQELKVSA